LRVSSSGGYRFVVVVGINVVAINIIIIAHHIVVTVITPLIVIDWPLLLTTVVIVMIVINKLLYRPLRREWLIELMMRLSFVFILLE